MKKLFIVALMLTIAYTATAQQQLAFPFQGGKQIMMQFFKENITIPPALSKQKANGLAIFKFTADPQGNIRKIIVYYADDVALTPPLIEALRKSAQKWIIPDKEKQHDFILPISIKFNQPAMETVALDKSVYAYYNKRHPLMAFDQIPIDMATLLPAVVISYDIAQ